VNPREFAEDILREHEARRAAAAAPWRRDDDPVWADLVALAAMATRWDLGPDQFAAKLERLSRTPTGVARPGAARMLALWRDRQAAEGGGPMPAHAGSIDVASIDAGPTDAEPADELPTILVVEDDPSLAELARVILQGSYRVVVAETGQEGLAAARRESPAAITLDLMLPDGHGARVLDQLKADPATARIPVIVTSAYTGGLPAKHRALAAAVLFKPFGPIELLESLRACLPDAPTWAASPFRRRSSGARA
jgi:CheY-like chemotaxis protein